MQAGAVRPGDLVVDFGKVAESRSSIVYEEVAFVGQVAVREEIVMSNIAGGVRVFDPAEQIRVFRKHD
jgi:hypothetical protein